MHGVTRSGPADGGLHLHKDEEPTDQNAALCFGSRDGQIHALPMLCIKYVVNNGLLGSSGWLPITGENQSLEGVLCTCGGVHPGRAELASSMESTASRIQAPEARRSCASSLGIFTQPLLHRTQPKLRGSRSSLSIVVHVFCWPPARLGHIRGRVAYWKSNQWSLLWTSLSESKLHGHRLSCVELVQLADLTLVSLNAKEHARRFRETP